MELTEIFQCLREKKKKSSFFSCSLFLNKPRLLKCNIINSYCVAHDKNIVLFKMKYIEFL